MNFYIFLLKNNSLKYYVTNWQFLKKIISIWFYLCFGDNFDGPPPDISDSISISENKYLVIRSAQKDRQ